MSICYTVLWSHRAILAATTINAPVVITIGTGTQQYPLTWRNCSQVTVFGICIRTQYSTIVSTNATVGTIKMLGRPCCPPNNALTSINGKLVDEIRCALEKLKYFSIS